MAEDDSTTIKGKSAFELFPDIMKKVSAPGKGGGERVSSVLGRRETRASASRIVPPSPPDLAKLLAAEEGGGGRKADAALALVLMGEGEERALVVKALEELGYAVESSLTQGEAVARMGMAAVGIVVFAEGVAEGALAHSPLHQYMRSMPMARRRSVYYVLVGPRFRTMYDLQALAESANLVLHPTHAARFDVILRWGLRRHEELFGPYVELLRELGRR